jgi:kynurenine formamidase
MRIRPAAFALTLVGTLGAALAQSTASHPVVTQAEFERWKKELNNWGRWGKNDQLGTLNLITPAKLKQAAALVKDGFSVSLSSDIPTEKSVDVPCPAEWAMTALNADRIAFPCIHGPGLTHLDSLAHVFFNGVMWNGDRVADVVTKEKGPKKHSIIVMKNGIVTRGVLYDMAKLKGVPYLEPGTRIYVEDLEAWERKSGVKAGPGDALLLGWGRWVRRDKLGPWNITAQTAGLDNSVIPWLKKRDIAILGWETPGYAPQPAGDLREPDLLLPGPGQERPRPANPNNPVVESPVHDFALAMLGIHVLDRADFTALSQAAAARNRWEFMLVIAPLAIPRGTGSVVNPIAVF